MSQFDELYGDATIAPVVPGANLAFHGNPPKSPTPQEVRL